MIKEQITSGKTLMEGCFGIMTLEKFSGYLSSQPFKMAGEGKANVVNNEREIMSSFYPPSPKWESKRVRKNELW